MPELIANALNQFPALAALALMGWWFIRRSDRQYARELAAKDAEIRRMEQYRESEISRLIEENQPYRDFVLKELTGRKRMPGRGLSQ